MKITESEKSEILALLALLKQPTLASDAAAFENFLGDGMLRVCLDWLYDKNTSKEVMRMNLLKMLVEKVPRVWAPFLRALYQCLDGDRATFNEYLKVSPFPDAIVIPFVLSEKDDEWDWDYDLSELKQRLDQNMRDSAKVVEYVKGAIILSTPKPIVASTDIMGSG